MTEAITRQGPRCPNCAVRLRGPFCHGCGQGARLQNRATAIAVEFVQGMLQFDNRLWRTLHGALVAPGRVSREWREGKRVRHVPPLAFFLFATLVLLAASSISGVS